MKLYSVFKSIAFKQDPELIHDFVLKIGKYFPFLGKYLRYEANMDLSLTIGDLKWSTPVGLAAGFDKNAQCIRFFENLNFGAIEVGTITKIEQKGNAKPRIQRHIELKSIRNSMGFPNIGAFKVFKNLIYTKGKIPIGANIGKNKLSDAAQAVIDYTFLYKLFSPVCDYIVINISSPNTPGLRDFQKKELLIPILEALSSARESSPKPIFIKISPDSPTEEIEMLCKLSIEYNFSGIIATNTTTQHEFGPGGISGQYLEQYAHKTRENICQLLSHNQSQSVIGVGGINSYAQIKEFWKMGGGFVQVYTGFIYQGPELLASIYQDMIADAQKNGFKSIQELYDNIKEID